MMWRFRTGREPEDIGLLTLLLILGGALVFTIVTRSAADKKMSYQTEDALTVEMGDTEEEPTDYYTYTDEIAGYELCIPNTWRQLSKEGVTYFVDQYSSASVKVTVGDYVPSINSLEADSVSETVTQKGMTFVAFNMISGTHHETIYQNKGNTTYDYLDEVYWSRSDIVTLQCIVKDEDYTESVQDLSMNVDSFVWTTENAVPEQFFLYYSIYGSCEIGIPASWTYAAGETYVVASDTENGSTYTLEIIENENSLANLTASDVAQNLNIGQSNFMLQQFSATEKEASVTARYLSGETWVCIEEKIHTNFQYAYVLKLEYMEGALEVEDRDLIFGLFREFLGNTD